MSAAKWNEGDAGGGVPKTAVARPVSWNILRRKDGDTAMGREDIWTPETCDSEANVETAGKGRARAGTFEPLERGELKIPV